MSTEDRVRGALEHAAEARDVDVAALHAAVRDELTRRERAWRTPRRAARTRVTWVAGLSGVGLAGALGAALLAGLPVLPGDADRGVDPGERPAGRGGVAEGFACPAQESVDLGPGSADDSFLPELTDDLRPAGEATAAPRWEVAEGPDGTTLLRLGDAGGALASVVTFRASGSGFRPVSVERCVDVGDGSRLLTPGLPDSPGLLSAADVGEGAVRVVDRASYDTVGLVKRHTVWAVPCGRSVCLVAGSRGDTITRSRLRPDDPTPLDRTSQLSDPDDVVGRASAQRLVVVYDGQGAVTGVTWRDRAGATTTVDPVRAATWPGVLYVFLAPTDDLAAVTVSSPDGDVVHPAGSVEP
ncbi:hypothetical protein [Nocardioides sp. Leaf285]|uniref:hypothetical protein n=1 Tax=Nocardioides sp. Leaf285 TaxID=1736322 RepID=UPI0007037C80|nr:hypothetical protein [Nocardioides sp. Leaf285]KQP64496.1 hypothetical protein ASF47_11090 [Nocardioides sp. Leaf285]